MGTRFFSIDEEVAELKAKLEVTCQTCAWMRIGLDTKCPFWAKSKKKHVRNRHDYQRRTNRMKI